MVQFKCVYFQTNSGRLPVKEFIDSLYGRTQQKYFEIIGLLEEYGKKLPKPHAGALGDDIHELRFSGTEGKIRILYFFYYENKIILTNGFIKKQQKIPRAEIELSKERRRSYIEIQKG